MTSRGDPLPTAGDGAHSAPDGERQLPAQPPSFDKAIEPHADEKRDTCTQECVELINDQEQMVKTIRPDEEHPALRQKAAETTPSVADTTLDDQDSDLQKNGKEDEDDGKGHDKNKFRSGLNKSAAAMKRANPIVEKTLLGLQKASLALVAVGLLLPCF